MSDRPYLSIGEVLSLLRDEFPDVTISKIRFLESQGLLDPERTASGYRKFYDADVERLRWILRQQREHFLPLKVIKGRLVGGPADDAAADHGAEAPSGGDHPSLERDRVTAGADSGSVATRSAAPASPAASVVAPQPSAARGAEKAKRESVLSPGISGASLTIEELASASGLAYDKLRELERLGFIAGRPVAGTVYFDEEALVVANLAAAFARFGVEGRHLRVYKNSAEREAGLFEQIVTPLLKQRNPEARRQAVETLEELTHLGQSLRAAVLRQAVRRLSGG